MKSAQWGEMMKDMEECDLLKKIEEILKLVTGTVERNGYSNQRLPSEWNAQIWSSYDDNKCTEG
jgi:hypothetical protein